VLELVPRRLPLSLSETRSSFFLRFSPESWAVHFAYFFQLAEDSLLLHTCPFPSPFTGTGKYRRHSQPEVCSSFFWALPKPPSWKRWFFLYPSAAFFSESGGLLHAEGHGGLFFPAIGRDQAELCCLPFFIRFF